MKTYKVSGSSRQPILLGGGRQPILIGGGRQSARSITTKSIRDPKST